MMGERPPLMPAGKVNEQIPGRDETCFQSGGEVSHGTKIGKTEGSPQQNCREGLGPRVDSKGLPRSEIHSRLRRGIETLGVP